MSISSLTSTSSTSTSTASASTPSIASSVPSRASHSVKSSPEYRALRQQLFHLQSSHSNLKLVHERESLLAATHKAQLQEKLLSLQDQLDEIRKDQVFLLESEREAKSELERIQDERAELEKSLKNRINELEIKLIKEQELNFDLQSQLTKSTVVNTKESEYSVPSDFNEILNQWKERVISLTNQNQLLESQLDELKSKTLFESYSEHQPQSIDSNEELRRKLLSTYVSLESAQTVLAQRKSEAERLVARIGNVKILEEKYRDSQIRIKRLENELASKPDVNNKSSSSSSRPESPALGCDLKLIELTKEIGSLKESLALSSLNYTQIQSDLSSKQSDLEALKLELEETKRTVTKLQTSIKVKDATISNLKEQLESTVNLLTDTLKKK